MRKGGDLGNVLKCVYIYIYICMIGYPTATQRREKAKGYILLDPPPPKGGFRSKGLKFNHMV